jgi:transcriptional regulator with XRE-family HTH domain
MIASNAYLSQIKHGKRNPSWRKARLLAQIYNVTLEELARCLDEHRLLDKPFAQPVPQTHPVEQPTAPPKPAGAWKAASRGKPIRCQSIYNAAGKVTRYIDDYWEVVPMDARRERIKATAESSAVKREGRI